MSECAIYVCSCLRRLAVNEPSLTERVEPLLQDLDTAYAQEWEDTIKAHKQEFDETTQHLGDLVDRQSLAIVDDLEWMALLRH